MPQMSPLMWSLLMLIFSLLILTTMVFLFFFSPNMNKTSPLDCPGHPISDATPLKWMW